ncbi:MAG: RNA polymerase sigma factor [Verrucomicrobiota bacterium]|jgi:RNA polymerase sigma-70 factor (ECF subfamily)
MVEPDEERDWIRKSQQGDLEAFEALVRRHQRMIHSLTYRMTGSLPDAEDLAQDTFLQAFRQLSGYRAEARFSTWVYRIAVNLCLNWKQRRNRQERLQADWSQNQAASRRSDSPALEQVQEALLKLPPKQRAAVILTAYDGLNHAEAARILGCSESTVSWRVFAARAHLKKLLANAQSGNLHHEE